MTPIKVHNITMGDMGGMGGIRCYGWYSVLWVVFGAMGGMGGMGGIRCYGWYSVLRVVFGVIMSRVVKNMRISCNLILADWHL